MSRHVELAIDHPENLAVRSDDEAGPLAWERTESFDAEECSDLTVRIGEKQEAEIILFVEGFLPAHRVGADPHACRREFGELRREIAKVTALDRSTRRHGLRVEK